MSFLEFWNKVKLFFATVWAFIKKWWQLFLVGLAFIGTTIAVLKWRSAANSYQTDIERINKEHRKELDDLQAAYKKDAEEKARIEAQYKALIEQLEAKNAELIKQIDSKKEKELKQIISETGDDPQKIADRFTDIFGIPITPGV